MSVNRVNGSSNTYVLRAKNYVASYHYLDGSHFTTDSGAIKSESANVIQKFYNGLVTVRGAFKGIERLQDAEFYNMTVIGLATTTSVLIEGGDYFNCTLDNAGSNSTAQHLNAFNCIIIARGGGMSLFYSVNISNCSIYNYANMGNYANCQQFNNCFMYSASSYGSYTEATTYYRNCTIISAVTYGAAYGFHENNSIISLAGAGATGATLSNCSVSSLWNNAAGHAYNTSYDNYVLKNNSFKVTNASANCLNATSAKTIYYAGSAFQGSTTPVNANITQGITNTHDNQGNILI